MHFHKFHFILDEARRLIDVAGLRGWDDVGDCIADLLVRFYWFLEKLHFTGKNRRCRHKLISPDLKDERIHFQLPLLEGTFQRLKQIHKDLALSTFCCAKVLRVRIFSALPRLFGR